MASVQLGSTQLLDRGCIPPAYGTRVVGGQDAARSPWMAYLIRNNAFACGGSLITHRFVLTAAHCTQLNDNLIVRLGEYDASTTWDGPTEEFRAILIFRHANYETQRYNNDIAMLKLDRIVQYKANIRPICILLNPNLRATINRIQEFVLTGWGQTSPFYPVMPTRLQHMSVTRYNYPLCYNQVEKICASNPSKFACSGDSGSPLGAHVMYNFTKIFAQFGVASTVTSCLGYGIYTDVFHHTPWILEVMRLYRN
ncbi:serine protease grass [Drosophila elegans]|uniref:serine protease grass n=1 Tax=Drosophila elegans TaxID=30023 RepID=UPI0007E6D115|nr:serine protease grass [Drosophila elegans]